MDVSAVYLDLYGRIPHLVQEAVDGLTPEQLREAPKPGANSIGWLVWHTARVVDAYGGELLGEPQLWESGDWAASFGLEPDPANHGYGHTPEQVAAVAPASAQACIDYHAAAHARFLTYLQGLASADLDRIVDDSYDPPVTLGVRLVSIADDGLQHAGQAAYVRGLLFG